MSTRQTWRPPWPRRASGSCSISADLRRPRLHELFGAPMSPGLTTVLLRRRRPGRGRVRHRGGTRPSSPATGLAPTQPRRGARLGAGREVLASYAERYDVVVVDSPRCSRSPTPPSCHNGQLTASSWSSPTARRTAPQPRSDRRGPAPGGCPRWGRHQYSGTTMCRPTKELGGQGYRYDACRSRGERRRVKRAAARRRRPEPRKHTLDTCRTNLPHGRADPPRPRPRGRLVRNRAAPVAGPAAPSGATPANEATAGSTAAPRQAAPPGDNGTDGPVPRVRAGQRRTRHAELLSQDETERGGRGRGQVVNRPVSRVGACGVATRAPAGRPRTPRSDRHEATAVTAGPRPASAHAAPLTPPNDTPHQCDGHRQQPDPRPGCAGSPSPRP